MMQTGIKSRLPLFIVLILFIAWRIPYLHYAYYWDESWPYAVAIKTMYHHGVSLMPNAVDAELSRGHPLFFHAIATIWMNIFGSSHISMHSFALAISLLLLITVYETALRLFSQRAAFLAVVLITVQEMFIIQSTMILFEMLVAFLCFASLALYVRGRYFLTFLCLTMLFYTKESGLIMGFVLGLDAIAGLLSRNIALKLRVYKVLSVAVPCVLICIFFLIQKHQRGWYIFPLYADLVQHRWDIFWYSFRINCISATFRDQLRFYYFLLLIVVATITLVKQRNWKLLNDNTAHCMYLLFC
jgi:4-amino-4-deoxy-L-arabinose transferase-like glycosyltransferase